MRKYLLPLLLVAFAASLPAQTSIPVLQGQIAATSTDCTTAFSCLWQSGLPSLAYISTVSITGTFTATLLVQESNNGGQTWSTAATLSAAGTTTYAVNGFTDIRIRCSAYTSGTAVISINTGLAGAVGGGGGGSGSLSGMTSGQVPIAATASTVTSSEGINGTDATLQSGTGTFDATKIAIGDANGGLTPATALPNGVTATTQSAADNTTKVATDAFVLANALANPMSAVGDFIVGGTAGAPARLPVNATSVPQTPVSVSGATTLQPAGAPINAQTGTTYTFVSTDRASYVSFSNAGAIAVTLPQAGTAGFASNFVTLACDIGAGTATITPTTSTISYTTGAAYTSAAASLALTTGQCAWIYSTNADYIAIVRSGNASNSFPLTVSGTVTSGGIPCFTATTTESSSALLTSNVLTKGGGAGACPTNSLTTDDGTSSTYTGTGGTKSPAFTSTGTTAGFHDYPQGTTSAAVAPCNVATSICEQAPAAVTSYLVTKPGAAGTGVRIGVNSSNVITENFSSAFGAVSQTAKTAAVTTFTVCAATANTACGQAGQYRLTYNVWGSGTACATVTAGSVVLNFTWTDENAVTHTTINAPMWDQKTAAMTSGQTNFNTALGTEGGSGSFIVSTNGTIIQAATTYTACTSGTGTYNVRITTEQLQ